MFKTNILKPNLTACKDLPSSDMLGLIQIRFKFRSHIQNAKIVIYHISKQK